MQVLHERGRLRPGSSGVGFGCGEEPVASWLAAHGVDATVTDLDPAAARGRGWMETGQHATGLDRDFKPALVDRRAFEERVRFEYVDMNALPPHLDGRFDFCWSACAMEHLGSIESGLRFVEAALRTLRPGGIAVHTTELNYLCREETVESGATVFFLPRHLEELRARLERAGHRVGSLDFRVGDGELDLFIDLPPFDGQGARAEALVDAEAHLKLAVEGYPVTSFGLVVEKG
jgi:SAM-dependent methyltransferase